MYYSFFIYRLGKVVNKKNWVAWLKVNKTHISTKFPHNLKIGGWLNRYRCYYYNTLLFLFHFSCYQDKLYTKLVPYLLWALPVGVRNLPIYFKIFNYLEYDVWKMFDQERRRPNVIRSLRASSFSEILKYYIFSLHDLDSLLCCKTYSESCCYSSILNFSSLQPLIIEIY